MMNNEGVDGDLSPVMATPAQEVRAKSIILASKRATLDESASKAVHTIGFFGLPSSGKSTYVKHLKLNYGSGMTEEERHMYHHTILSNLFNSLRSVFIQMQDKGIEF